MLAFVSKFGIRRNQTLIFPLKFNPKTTFPPQNPFIIRPISSKSDLSTSQSDNPVLKILKEYGLTDSNIVKAVGRMPALVSFHPDQNLRPKMEFLQQKVGLSGAPLAKLVVLYPWFLLSSLENAMVPSLEILTGFLNSKEDVLSSLKRSPSLLSLYNAKCVSTNMKFLKSQGVPELIACKLLIKQPRSLMADPVQFAEVVEDLKSSGARVSSLMFIYALQVKVTMTAAKWDKKVAVYKEFGWSDSEIQLAFKKWPYVLALSTEKIKKNLDFTMNKLKMGPSLLSRYPILLTSSLEKRLIPRCAVLGLLISNGVVDKEMNIAPALTKSTEMFERDYVSKYKEVLPAVLKAHEGKMEFVGFESVEIVNAKKKGK